MKAERLENKGCLQMDSAEREEYAGAQSIDKQETEEADGAELLERILDRDDLNRAYKRVKANKGAPGIDGMTVEDALSWLREHKTFWKAFAAANTSHRRCAGRKSQSRMAEHESLEYQLL